MAAHQQVTYDWWEKRRSQFELYISQLVIQEAGRGDKEEIAKRSNALADIPLLELRTEALNLADMYVGKGALSERASDDALHIAVATIYGINYLLTWNCKHMANAEIQKQLAKISSEEGYEIPTICTPYELMGE